MTHFDVEKRTIFLVNHGSHAYGLNTPTSDRDYKGVCIKTRECYFGFLQKFEQYEHMGSKSDGIDRVIYSLDKFAKLASECNPNIIEMLYTDDSDVQLIDVFGERLRSMRQSFLSRKAKHTFAGYAHAQLKRINLHHRWLVDQPKAPPSRVEFGLPERTLIPTDQLAAANAAIQQKLDSWSADFLDHLDPALRIMITSKMSEQLAELEVLLDSSAWVGAARSLGYSDNFIELLDRERRYTGRQRDWEHFQEWKKSRNPARAALEAKFGYDTKHGMHLVRLTRMCKEILSTGNVVVKRPDREELLAIRNGAWTYEQLLEYASKIDVECDELYAKSTLPHSPDREAIDHEVVSMTQEYIGLHG